MKILNIGVNMWFNTLNKMYILSSLALMFSVSVEANTVINDENTFSSALKAPWEIYEQPHHRIR